jgi:hypothetical protein
MRTQTKPKATLAQVQFADRQARISGPGIRELDLVQSGEEGLELPNGLTGLGSLWN